MYPRFLLFTINIKIIDHLLLLIKFFFITFISVVFSLQAESKDDFLAAKKAIENGSDIADYKSLKQSVIYPYLLAYYYKNHLDENNEIINFTKNNLTITPVRQLYYQWLNQKYIEKNYSVILDNYLGLGLQNEDCIYRDALLKTNQTKQALNSFERLWLESNQLPSSCEDVINAWGRANQKAYLLKKVVHDYQLGKTSHYLQQLDPEDQKIFNTYLDYLKKPEQLLELDFNILINNKLKKALLPRVLAALARIDSVLYTDFVLSFDRYLYSRADYQQLLSKLSLYLLNRNSEKFLLVYSKIIKPTKKDQMNLLRYLVIQKDWHSIINKIPKDLSDESAMYWLGVSYKKTGKSSQAKKILSKLATHRSYYGFLAADSLNQHYRFNDEQIKPIQSKQYELDKSTILKRVLWFQKNDLDYLGRSELIRLQKQLNQTDAEQLAYWLNQKQIYFESIYILGKIKRWNDIRIRFPIIFKDLVFLDIDRSVISTWVFAIMRQESTMNSKAISPSGAKGLMQIMPKTAKHIAKNESIALKKGDLLKPDINILLGKSYLEELAMRFNSISVASAAYNAGPTRVSRWVNGLDQQIWIESIPLNETRKYVKNILEYQQVYAYLLGQKIPRVSNLIKNIDHQ